MSAASLPWNGRSWPRARLAPLARSARTLARPRVTGALQEALDYRLTILQAGAGYGKSTELALLHAALTGDHSANENISNVTRGGAAASQPRATVIWYSASEEDRQPRTFLLHLCYATLHVMPGFDGLPVEFLETWENTHGPLPTDNLVDGILNAFSTDLKSPTLIILDDLQAILGVTEIALALDRLVGLAPAGLHFLLSGRPPLQLPNLARWRAQGEVLQLEQSLLAFRSDEIEALFNQSYGYELREDEAAQLLHTTEGWAIALLLIWQGLRTASFQRGPLSLEQFLSPVRLPSQLEGSPNGWGERLFEILAHEVFAGQPPDVQDFLLAAATLREMTAEACDAVRGAHDSTAMLAYLRRQELFVSYPAAPADSRQRLRFHPIFHQFLRSLGQTHAAQGEGAVEVAFQRKEWQRRAAEYFSKQGDLDRAVEHLRLADQAEKAAEVLDEYGAKLLADGQLDALAAHLDGLPPEILRQHPSLLAYLGDLARLHSRFQEALGWYDQAQVLWRERHQMEGVARALRGQARVYLDTVNPTRAEELLQEALRLSDGIADRESQARLYELLAENKLNAGQPAEAERLSRQAEELRAEGPSDSQLRFRVLLRTGRLEEARRGLEARAELERQAPVLTPRAHRETLLMLSLIYSLQGQASQAFQAAQEGTRRGAELHSPFITAVGHMRQGHALMLLAAEASSSSGDTGKRRELYQQAEAQFNRTIEISQTLAVSRLRVEAYWGLARVFGYQGDLTQASELAQQGIEIASQAGDEWIASLIRLTLGASLTLAARYEAAEEWLGRARLGFQECSDPFGECASRIWLCLAWQRNLTRSGKERSARLEQVLPEVLNLCRQNDYEALFTRPSLLGPPDERLLVPLLLFARQHDWQAAYAERLLQTMGLHKISLHPGYRLHVRTLGEFCVWRGAETVNPPTWRREKARQLFQILITFRDRFLEREQICEYLWPDQDPTSAQRSFKVTLNALYQVLEPEREPGQDSAYITRQESAYRLRPEADLVLDVEEFLAAVQRAENQTRNKGLEIQETLEQAVSLYTGEYLVEARYETWAAAEREHLAVLFLRLADRLSVLLAQQERYEECLAVCQRILAQDNCWERAYRQMMLSYHQLGDQGQMARSYQRCVQTLQEELDVEPAPETRELYQKLTNRM